jgi:hypothetical protein
MNSDNPIQNALNLWQQTNFTLLNIATSLAHLADIQTQRLTLEQQNMTPAIITALINAINALTALINTDNTNAAAQATALAAAQASLATLQATDAALQDPALLASANAAIAAASAVQPPAPPAAPVAPLFDPTATYTAGQEVTDATGNVWTAVTPVVGEAPGITAGNWTLTTPAPVAAANLRQTTQQGR